MTRGLEQLDDRKTIAGQWEMPKDGKQWDLDFDPTYTKQ